jgi:hypothetical protein
MLTFAGDARDGIHPLDLPSRRYHPYISVVMLEFESPSGRNNSQVKYIKASFAAGGIFDDRRRDRGAAHRSILWQYVRMLRSRRDRGMARK